MTHRQKGSSRWDYASVMKKKLWSARDISIIFHCSRQRVYDYAERYGWESVHDTPLLWNPQDVLKDREEILKRRKESPHGWLVQTGKDK